MPEEPQRQIIFQIMIALENLQKIRRKIENVGAPTFQTRLYGFVGTGGTTMSSRSARAVILCHGKAE
jgi:hypothetical protein